ncbi:MAG TPA: FHA domain-containing protein [Bryobacteraceae bacterium]|jgi:hypothetical protein
MRAILEVTEGPLAGRRIEVYPGHSISFGRTVKADIAVPGDGYMSGRHFAVENTGDTLFVHDLGSSNGTFVNGTRVDRAPANAQDLIAAGSSKFLLHIEQEDPVSAAGMLSRTSTMPRTSFGNQSFDKTQVDNSIQSATRVITPINVEVPSRWPGFTAQQTVMLEALYAPAGNVYVYLNSLKEQLIQAFVEASGEQFLPLTQALVAGRPMNSSYVVALPRNSRLHNVLLKEGWGKMWGVYCSSPAPLEQVAGHLRAFASVQSGTGVPLNLPLADPQFLRVLLGSLSPTEGIAVFGPIRHFFLEAEGGETLFRCTPAVQGVAIETVKLKA